MDLLTHLFLPATVARAVLGEDVGDAELLALACFAVVPDFDKYLGSPGLLHSLVTIVPVGVGLLAAGRGVRARRGRSERKGRPAFAPLACAFLASHFLLDFVDGGPLPLLFPFSRHGVGLTYPARVAFGDGAFGLTVRGPVVALREAAPRPGHNAYGFLNAFGVASALAFAAVWAGRRLRGGGVTRP